MKIKKLLLNIYMNITNSILVILSIGLIYVIYNSKKNNIENFTQNGGTASTDNTTIVSIVNGEICGLEWDGTLDENKERKAKWDCDGGGDPVIIEGNKIYSMAEGKKCGLEWDGTLDENNERKAKWDCSGAADPIEIRKPNNSSDNSSNNSSNVNSAPYNPPISLSPNLSGLDTKTFNAIKQEINRQYNMDIEAIRNLGAISKSLLTGKNYHNTSANGNPGTLTIPADIVIEGKLTSKKEVEFTNKNSSLMNVLPKGVILAWYESSSKIPSGWALCNGQSGTPDLRNRFIYGGSTTPGNEGGSTTVTLNETQIPAHRHYYRHAHYSGQSANNNRRAYGGAYHSGTVPNSADGSMGDVDQNDLDGGEHHVFTGPGVSHGTGSGNDNTNNTGGSKSHENMPPYHTLLYIMKL